MQAIFIFEFWEKISDEKNKKIVRKKRSFCFIWKMHSWYSNKYQWFLFAAFIDFIPAAGLLNSFNFTDSIIIALPIFIDETHKYV